MHDYRSFSHYAGARARGLPSKVHSIFAPHSSASPPHRARASYYSPATTLSDRRRVNRARLATSKVRQRENVHPIPSFHDRDRHDGRLRILLPKPCGIRPRDRHKLFGRTVLISRRLFGRIYGGGNPTELFRHGLVAPTILRYLHTVFGQNYFEFADPGDNR